MLCSKYYNYEVSNNGSDTPIHHGNDYGTDYYTDVLKNESTAWLKSAWNPDSGPFFMMIGTPCPHVPNVFAPQVSLSLCGALGFPDVAECVRLTIHLAHDCAEHFFWAYQIVAVTSRL